MFADNQSGSKTPVVSDYVKIICSTGDSSSAQCFNMYEETRSGPLALLTSRVERRCCIPD